MPRMLPELGPPELLLIKSLAERRFYQECRTQLPDNWTVLFSTPWVGTTPSGRKYDGEADFILMMPGHGFLVVEVKGGGISYDPERDQWESVDRNGTRHPIKDPFRQAASEKHQIVKILQADDRWRSAHPGRVPTGHAVMMVDVDRPEAVSSPRSPKEIVGGRPHMADLRRWIESVLTFWRGQEGEGAVLGPEGIRAAETILHGRIEVRPVLSAQLAEEEAIRVRLTQQQSRVLRALGTRTRAAVCGGAGTGKTLMALERAKQLSMSVGDTLLLCYNNLLGDFLKTTCRGADRLHAMTFHQLCAWRVREVSQKCGRDLMTEAKAAHPALRKQDEFDFQLPYALTLSCEILPDRYDAIVIDEGQDFKEEYWLPIEWLLRDADRSFLYVFYDQNQALYTRAKAMPISDPPYILTLNCRNTLRIHEAAYRHYRGEATDGPSENEGAPVAALSAPSVLSQAQALHAAIVRLIDKEALSPEQIAVLVCGEPKEQFYRALDGRPLPHGARWALEGVAADRGVRVDTVRRFKGLEADVVFLWGIDAVPIDEERELLYVGLSRAKSRLTLVGTSDACSRLQKEAPE